jgi:hypothetical protein
MSGEVRSVSDTGDATVVDVGSDGAFQVTLPVAHYTVDSCSTTSEVTLSSSECTSVEVQRHVP